MLNIELINTIEGFLKLKPVWNEVLSKSDSDIPFMTFEWFEFWWKMFGSDSEMLVFVVREDSEITGFVPLIRKRTWLRGLRVTMISFMANYYSVRTAMVIARDGRVFPAILDYLKEAAIDFDIINLDLLVSGSATDLQINDALAPSNGKKRQFLKMNAEQSPYIVVESDWAAFMKSRSHNFRHNLTRAKKRFNEEPGYEIAEYSQGDVQKGINELLDVSRTSWKYKAGTAIVNSKEKVRFFSEFAYMACMAGWLRLYILKVKREPIAFVYCLLYKQKLYGLKIGYNDEFARFSPGEFLRSQIFERFFKEEVKEIDLLGDKEPSKMNWTSLFRSHSKYWIYGDTIKGRLLLFIESYVVQNIKKIRRWN
jgi:CelD/BcsL family acetyltransferase involved in cellulose biosynthesis